MNDIQLLYYLLINKVASRKQINRDVYLGYWPQNVRHRLANLKRNKFICVKRPLADWNDQTYLYSLTTKGFNFLSRYLKESLSKKRLGSNSIEHDLGLVDIRQILIAKSYVKKYFTENQVHNESQFYEEEDLKLFNQLRFDALLLYSKELGKRFYLPVQYERSSKGKRRYQDIIGQYYLEDSLSTIIYISSDNTVERVIKKIENEIEPDKAYQKIFYGKLSDLKDQKSVLKFYTQSGKAIRFE